MTHSGFADGELCKVDAAGMIPDTGEKSYRESKTAGRIV